LNNYFCFIQKHNTLQMDQTENSKKKNRFIPLIWLFGIGLTGGLVTMGILLAKKNKQVSGLEQQLSQTTTTLNGENDALHNELKQAANEYTILQSQNEVLDANLSELKDRNRQLSGKYYNLVEREQQCRDDYNALLSSFDQLRSENELLKTNLASQQSDAEYLKNQLINRDSLLASREEMITNQQEKLKADSSVSAAIIDSVIRENSSRFVNITELNGAYGLNVRHVSYAHYFYGLTNVSGLFVNKHFISGIGLGVLAYDEGLTAPLYLDFRYHFTKRNFTPYIYADGGLVFQFDDPDEPMLFINPGVGLYKSISDKFALNLGAGLYIQRDVMAKASFINFKLGLIYIKGGQ
jgi:hypothetical protein